MSRVHAGRVSEGKRLRILFFVDRPGVLRQFASLLTELAARGHDVRIELGEWPVRKKRSPVVSELKATANVTLTGAPRRSVVDGWRTVAWVVRALGDLARYAHPRYASAPGLRSRIAEATLFRLGAMRQLDPLTRAYSLRLARRLAGEPNGELSERIIRRAALLESAIPASGKITRAIRDAHPDVVLATSLMKAATSQVEYLKSARKLRIPSGICVASWDNLTNKGLLKFVPERVFVWNEVQRREAVELHGIPPDRVVATGAQRFDPWFERRASTTSEEFRQRVGLDPSQPYVLFLGSSPFVTNHSDDEVAFVRNWIRALRESDDARLRTVGVMIRPHPVGHTWRRADVAGLPNIVVWPESSTRPFREQEQDEFFDSLAHSAAVVGINTTAMIEAAVVGKSVLTVLAPEFGQESTLHFHYLLEENGGFLHVASSLEEHTRQLASVLEVDEAGAERRRSFVASFVRPNGIDRPATPIYADAVEELAALPVQEARCEAPLSARVALWLEAAYSSAVLVAALGWRRVRRVPTPRRDDRRLDARRRLEVE